MVTQMTWIFSSSINGNGRESNSQTTVIITNCYYFYWVFVMEMVNGMGIHPTNDGRDLKIWEFIADFLAKNMDKRHKKT